MCTAEKSGMSQRFCEPDWHRVPKLSSPDTLRMFPKNNIFMFNFPIFKHFNQYEFFALKDTFSKSFIYFIFVYLIRSNLQYSLLIMLRIH